MRKTLSLVTVLLFLLPAIAQQNASVSFEKWLSLKGAGGVVISADGKYAAYTVTSTDWTNNSYDSEIWLYREGESPFQLTRTSKGSSSAARFTPDSKYISFLADRGDKTQIYLIPVTGGEAFAITKDEDGIGSYEWSPDGKYIAVTKTEPDSKKDKASKERYGGFAVEGEEYKLSHLWLLRFNYDSVMAAGMLPCYTSKADSLSKNKSADCVTLPKAERLTEGNYTVAGFRWSPDGKYIAFTRQPDPLINSSVHADIALTEIATKKVSTVINNPGSDFFEGFSADGKQFVYTSNLSDTSTYFYKNNRVFIYDFNSKSSREIATDFDENKNVIEWNEKGIYFNASQKTKAGVFNIDPATGKITALSTGLDITNTASFNKGAERIAFTGRNFTGLNEVFIMDGTQPSKKVTHMSEQLANWSTPVNEIIQWKSKDGALIEGVLLKPKNYDPTKKYPLLVVIHGGPTGVDRPEPTPTYVYPIMQWCEKGAVVLRVNYRGSAGYGEKFRTLNVRNLGVGDMWDVVSGVEYLNKQGIIDTSRMGCMGWSQGGYISAFLTTNTTIFKAISVGAGISNWVTYYVNTDITPFTRQYLQATPWSDMDIYLKTSPMTNINKARTPTLIQHGEFDKRVPIPNAYELYRGLQDRGIPSKLVVYKGFGHGITKPKERLAAIWHNWLWFNHYVFGDKMGELPGE
jgi:dipeptidyl aminopeptidase/acylaminoacyl peptidase